MKYFLAFFLLAAGARADINVSLVHAKGPYSLTRGEILNGFKDIEAEFEPIFSPLHLVSLRSVRNPYQKLHSDLNNRLSILLKWQTYFARVAKKRFRSSDEKIAILPPTFSFKTFWVWGYASAYCTRYGVAVVAGTPTSFLGLDRRPHFKTALYHELLHLLGAKHINSEPNLMHSDALSFVDLKKVPLLRETIDQVLKCIRRW